VSYFKIDGVDYSKYVNQLRINKSNIYNSQTNAAGNTVVDYINSKREIEVGIIPLDAAAMAALQTAIDDFNVSISFRNPKSSVLEEGVNCIIPDDGVEYYTIQDNKVMYNAFTLKFIEL
jgi:hypothetical protein